jgi:hypothetical protein
MQTTSQCVYCGSSSDITQDHIPPKSFFPKPRPSNLITVPACKKCNQGFEKDEELFLATFMFTDAGVSDTGKSLWDEKLHRMYEKNLGLKRKIAQLLKEVDVKTPSGIFLGRRMAIQLDGLRSQRVINKILFGLYYFEFQEILPFTTKLNIRFAQYESDVPQELKDLAPSLLFGTRQWANIFEYRFNRVKERPQKSIWIIRFFGKAVFWAITE